MGMQLYQDAEKTLDQLGKEGLLKGEVELVSAQSVTPIVDMTGKGKLQIMNFCANNYLGLANHPLIIKAVQNVLNTRGFGTASVRFICGTQDIHRVLEAEVSHFLRTDDSILYSSCFDANTGFFETFLKSEDAIISDALNHASIIDGIRLCKARRLRYRNNDMNDLEDQLKQCKDARYRVIATDGVFSMDGVIVNLPAIIELADRYDALVFLDDSHAIGFMGENGAGIPDHWGLLGHPRLIISGTFGKALGGGSGGYVAASKPLVEVLRQRSRPYLFSNSLIPCVVAGARSALSIVRSAEGMVLRERLWENVKLFRGSLEKEGFEIAGGGHPIIPLMTFDAVRSQEFASLLVQNGIYVASFSYPVVPAGQARIRMQVSAAHSVDQLIQAIDIIKNVAGDCGISKVA